MLIKIYFLLLYLIMKCQTFQFKSPYVSVSPSTINTLGQYQIIVQRQFTQQVTNTAWNTTAVPAGSSIVAIFPPQFALSGNQVCQFISIGSDMPTFTCNIYTSNNTISFDGAITTNQFISDVTMSIANVLNPFPAITTSPFLVTVGTDYSATDPFAAVSLTPALFATTLLSFNPDTVNTTSNMIINLTTTNKLPFGSSIVVKFPYNLQWAEDVSSSHQLQLISSMVCSSLSSAVSTGIQCSGLSSTQEVTITSLSTVELPALTTVIFSINNLFSPPTQNPLDNIIVTSLVTNSNGSYLIDKSTATFSGLTARTLTDLAIQPTTTTKTINTNIGLKISFTILDTITNADYFQVAFPAGTLITYTTSLSTFSLLSNVTYNSATGVLSFYQSTISATRSAGTSAYITFLTYKTPNSTKPTSPIIFRVMKNGYAKMRGSSIFTADPKAYTFNVSTNDSNVNARAWYQINFGLADSLDPSGYIILTLPPELVQDSGGISVIISSNSSVINTSPTVAKINSTSYSITNLNKTSSALLVPSQSLTLIVSGVAQPDASRVISNFYFSIYFNTENYLTAYGAQNNTITIITGAISAVTASVSTMVTYSLADLSVVANYQNSVPVGGFLYLGIPSDISLPSTLACSLQSNSTLYSTTCAKQSSIIIFTVTTLIPAGSQLTAKVMGITTPISTMPTVTFTATTKNANNLTIDTSTSFIQVTMTQPTQLSNLQISRSSNVNFQLTQFTIVATSLQTLYSYMNNIIYFQFPIEVTVTTLSISLMNQFNATSNISYNTISLSPLKVSILLPSNTTSLTGYSFIFNGLVNPPSLKPTTLGLLVTMGFNLTTNNSINTYLYATTTSNTIQNTIAADFTSIAYTFSKSILFSYTNLSINLGLVAANKIGMIQLQLDTSIQFKDNTTLSICSSPQMSTLCTVTSSSPSIIQITPIFPSSSFGVSNSSLNISVGLIATPTFYSTSYPASILTAFDASNYPISRNITYLKFISMCPMPCWSCTSNQSSQCTSCYLLSHDVTNLLYYVQTTNQSYGQCLSSCPSGYYINSSNIYQCLPCNSNCVECATTSVNCTVCSPTTYLYTVNSTCMIQCPNGTYPAISSPTNLCAACPTSCQICSSLTACTKCQSGYFLYSNFCYSSCPINYTIANSTTRVCDPCSIACLSCLTMPTYCTSCPNSLVLTNGTCLNTCPSISMIPINGTCTLCTSPCQTCSITLNNCTSCYTNSSLPYLYNSTCLSTCPDTYYGAVSTTFNCLSCNSLNIGCLNCSTNGQYCLSCDLGYLYFNNSQCLNYTPNGYANISGVAVPCTSGCSTCIGTTTNCTGCLSPLLFYSNSCVSACPNFTTVINGSCLACLSPCSQCSGTINYCLSCVNSFFLNSYHQCVNGSGCPNYTYPNSTTGTCMQCNSPCLQCSTSIACNSCIQGFYFYSITTLCLDVCPSGWVGVVDLCVPCTSPCKYCEIDPQHCTSCITNYYLNPFTHQCLLQCPAQVTISNPITMTCDLCNATCATCQNQTTICTSCIASAYLLGTQCFSLCPSGYYGQLTSNTCQECNPVCLTCSTASTQCTSCYSPQYLFNSTCVSSCPPAYGIMDNNGNCIICSIRLQNCLTCTSSGSCINCQSPSILLNGQCYTDCPTGYVLNSTTNLCETTDQNAQQELNNSLSSSSVFPMPFTCIGFSIFIAFLMSKLQNKNTYLIGSGYGLLGILETVSLAYLIIKYANYNKSLQASSSAVPLANQFPLLAVGLIIIYSLNLIGFVAQTPILCSDTKFEGWLKSGVHKFIFILVTLFSLLVNYKIKLFIFTKLFGFTSTRSQLESVQKFRSFNILSFLGVSHEIFVIYISIVMLTKLPTTILNNEMFLIFIDTLVITFVTIIFSILANKKDDDFFTQLADNGYVLNKKVMVEGDDICQQPLEPKYLRGDENKQGKVNQMDSFQKMISHQHEQVDIYEDEEISLSISENKSELDRRQRVPKKKQKTSQISDNQSNSDKNKTRLKIKENNRLHFSNDQTSNPIKKQLLNAGEKDVQLNQIVRQSVIFDREKDYDQQQVISKNQTVLIESPSKKQQKKQAKQAQDQLSKQKQKKLNKKQNLNLFFNENQQNQTALQQITLQNQKKHKIQQQQLQNNHQSKQIIEKNVGILIQQNKKENENQKENQRESEKDREKVLKETEKEKIINEKEKEKEQKKRQEKKKESEAKIFREQKILSKQDLQNEQIKKRIAVKLRQLEGLKRQNSQKELRRSRQKQKEREKQSVKNSIVLKTKSKQKQGSQKQSEQKSFNNFFERDQKQIQATPENNLTQLIRQNSTLIRLENQQMQKNLAEQKQHQTIKQEIDMINSMALSKIQSKKLQDQSQLGKLYNKSKNNTNNSNHNEEILQLKSSQNIRDEKQIVDAQAFGQRIQDSKNFKLNEQQGKSKKKIGEKEKPKIHIENMYDSVVKMEDEPSISDDKRQSEHKQTQINQNKNDREIYEIDENMSEEQDYQKKNKYRKGVEIGIGESLENILQNSPMKDKDKQKSRYQNMFQLQNDQRDLQDSGLEDSQPYMDEEINHRPLRSSFATERRSLDAPQTQLNNDKHPLIGILKSGQQGLIRHQIPKMNDQSERPSNREEESKTKMQKYGGNGSGEQQTLRKQQDRPPLQRPITNQRNRIYAAGLRQFEEISNAQKSSLEHHLNENSKQSLEIQQKNKQKKRNHSLYEVKLNKLESKESKDNSSDNTEDILMRPGFSNQNSSIEDMNFIKPKYTQTMVIENLNQVPEKPKVGMTTRINYNNRISTSQQRGGRNRNNQNLTAGQHMFTKKSSVEYQQDDQEDQLDHFYGKQRESKKRKSPKRSKSKQRMHSKQSVKRMRQIQKVYLQRLQPPKRKN